MTIIGKKVNEMAHLNEKTISDQSCKAIIIDTLMAASQPFTKKQLSREIESTFRVIMAESRLKSIIGDLVHTNTLQIGTDGILRINPIEEARIKQVKQEELKLQSSACAKWLEKVSGNDDFPKGLKDELVQALPIYLRSIFVRHGVISYMLLSSNENVADFNIDEIAQMVSFSFSEENREAITKCLPTVFSYLEDSVIMEYVRHSINKAVGYISEVISQDTADQLSASLKGLVLYLDTNTIYRLLNLQGQERYEAVKETIDFCKSAGVSIRVSAVTQKELSNRLKFDSGVLIKYPIATNLERLGYKYRTSENFVSTYWKTHMDTGMSVQDYINYYTNYDVLLEEEGILLEEHQVDDEQLLLRAKEIFSKLSLRDPEYKKGDYGLWHDAYNMAYVQKMQRLDAKTALDTGYLFLTTDHSLAQLQQEDHELKAMPPVSISPSQMLQIYSFSRPGMGYEETFVKFFHSSTLGSSFLYDNDDIHEIMSRISHYKNVDVAVGEKILSKIILESKYKNAQTDDEKEEVVYKEISDELTIGYSEAKSIAERLQQENEMLFKEKGDALQQLQTSTEQFSKDLSRLKQEKKTVEEYSAIEVERRKRAENENRALQAELEEARRHISAERERYAEKKWKGWKKGHLGMFFGGILIAIAVLVCTYLCVFGNKGNSAWLGLLALLAIPLPMIGFGYKVFSPNIEQTIRQQYRDEYNNRPR